LDLPAGFKVERPPRAIKDKKYPAALIVGGKDAAAKQGQLSAFKHLKDYWFHLSIMLCHLECK
jgi:hypothetical protein